MTWKVFHYAESSLNQPGKHHGREVFFHQLEVSADEGVVDSLPPKPCTTQSMLPGIPAMLQWCLG